MKKIFLIVFLFIISSILFLGQPPRAHAACTNTSATCAASCPTGTSPGSGTCFLSGGKTGVTAGKCCVPNNLGTGTGNSTCQFCASPKGSCSTGTTENKSQTCYVTGTNNRGKCCVTNTGTGTGTSGTGTSSIGSPIAQFNGSASCGNGTNEVWTLDCVFPLLERVINWALILAGTVATILIIYSGIRLITSGGNQKNVETAKKILTYAIAGLVLVFMSFLIINIIAYATKTSCITMMGFQACL